jgi:rRNA maturation RNase YbeY
MRSLNRKYRARDYPTDVLAFPMESMGEQQEMFLGDVVICLPVAIEQASRFGNTANQEMLRLLIHGTLHLLGYDHEQSPREATRMQRKERAIFQTLSPVPPLLTSIG